MIEFAPIDTKDHDYSVLKDSHAPEIDFLGDEDYENTDDGKLLQVAAKEYLERLADLQLEIAKKYGPQLSTATKNEVPNRSDPKDLWYS